MSKEKNIIKRAASSIRNSINKKMFIITVIMVITFLITTLVVQKSLFTAVYNKQKETYIKNNVMKFSEVMMNAQNESQILEYIEKYQSNYNTSIAVLDTSTNILIQFKTNSDILDKKNSNIIDYVVQTIDSDGQIIDRLNNGKEITLTFSDSITKTKYLASAVLNDSKLVIGFTSLQQITEASGVISQFYQYFFIGAVLLAVILAFIYSRFITRPLRQINRVALKLSNLDFSERCNVNNKDEIGNLGHTLNFLSDNLDESLTSLNKANAKLKEDIDKERKIEAMRKEFIADVSHELKTPITLIKGYAEGIKDGIFLEGNIDTSLDVIVEESEKMSKLVKDMLQLSSLESGKEHLNKETFDLGELINKVVMKLRHSIDEKSLKVESSICTSMVNADAFKIEQVITNFMTNAIKHTFENRGIYINMISKGNSIYVSVENEGKQIASDDIDKLWDKFYKVDKSRNRKDGGTGLGLSIVKNILDLHGGTYGVENTERGVKFYFTIPEIKALA